MKLRTCEWCTVLLRIALGRVTTAGMHASGAWGGSTPRRVGNMKGVMVTFEAGVVLPANETGSVEGSLQRR